MAGGAVWQSGGLPGGIKRTESTVDEEQVLRQQEENMRSDCCQGLGTSSLIWW